MAGSDAQPAAAEALVPADDEWRDEQLQRVRAVYDSVDTSTADADLRLGVVGQLPESAHALLIGVGVFRDLLRVELRPDRFRSLLRIWSGRVTDAVRSGDFEGAGLWMRALTEAPVFAEEFSPIVAAARRDLSQPELFDTLVKSLIEADDPPAAAPLLASWGEPLVEYLIEQMAVDEPVIHRRHIVEYLGMAGRGDARLLTARLNDPRWYIVRNIATALGRAGRVSALPALEGALAHDDDRVRVEVIRAIVALRGDDAVPVVLHSLTDPSPKVRQAAASLLRASAAGTVVPGIVDVLEQGAGSAEDGRRLVEILAERRTAEVREALSRLASRRFALGASKAVKDAARLALKEWDDE